MKYHLTIEAESAEELAQKIRELAGAWNETKAASEDEGEPAKPRGRPRKSAAKKAGKRKSAAKKATEEEEAEEPEKETPADDDDEDLFDDDDDDGEPTPEELRAELRSILQAAIADGNREEAKALLAKCGAKKVSDVPEAKLQKAIKAAKKL